MAAKAVNLNVAVENLTLRDGRVKIDNVRDDVEDELNKEVNVIEGIKRNLQQKCAQAFEQLCLLQVIMLHGEFVDCTYSATRVLL